VGYIKYGCYNIWPGLRDLALIASSTEWRCFSYVYGESVGPWI